MSKPYWNDHEILPTSITITYETRRLFRRVAEVVCVLRDVTTNTYLIPNFPKRGTTSEFPVMPMSGAYIYEVTDRKTGKKTQIHCYISRR